MLLSDTQSTTFGASHTYLPARQERFDLDDSHHGAAFFDGNPSDIDLDDINFDLDIDGHLNAQSISSSPVSTQSLLSHYSGARSSPLSTFDSIPTTAASRGAQDGSLLKLPSQATTSASSGPSAQLFGMSSAMQTDSWLGADQLTPKSVGRFSHQRESSLSSLGSAGPASPYSHNTSNPQIAVTDSLVDGFHGLQNPDELNYQLAKSFPAASHDTFYANYPNYTSADAAMVSATGYSSMSARPRQKASGGLLSAAEHSIGSTRSRPVSVASSINSDSPATPSGEPDEDRRRKNSELSGIFDYLITSDDYSPDLDDPVFNSAVPKLDRTMTDIYNDELYNPNFSIGGATHSQMGLSSGSDLFAQRLQAANNQHLSAGHSPVSAASRERSPFRTDSPLAPSPMHDFSTALNAGVRFGSAHPLRDQRHAVQDAQAAHQQMIRGADTSNPPTISPKDAMLDFSDADAAATMPLFPQQTPVTVAQPHHQQFHTLGLDDSSFGNYVTSHLHAGIQIPQQYPFIAQPRQQSSVPSLRSGSLSNSRLSSTDIGSSTPSSLNSPQRPAVTSADGGTYTCTYHGCTLRFETPALLQKHKREGHRQTHGLGSARKVEIPVGPATGLLNSQAGPHRCDRINPSTGKPCSTIFSRPYDLTRHEDTIHNARKQKVRCDLCTDEKTFSRADALTRHYRVCHPDVELQGKHRRRAAHA